MSCPNMYPRLIQEDLGPKNMFLKQVRLDELESLPRIKGGIQMKPLRRKKDEVPDMEMTIDLARYKMKAGEIGLKLPLWSNVEFTTEPTRLVIDIPDSDEEDLCHRNVDQPARLAICRLDPKLLEKTSPFVDGIVSSDGNALTVRAIFNKDAKPSNCDPEIEMMGLGNWNVVNPSPDLDVDVFQSSANYCINMGKIQLEENEMPRDTVLLQKESLEDQVALRPLEVPNVDLAFNFGNDLGPETRWKFSAKCQKSGVQTAVPLEDFVLKPRAMVKVGAAPPHLFGIQHIMDSLYDSRDVLEDHLDTSSSVYQKAEDSKIAASEEQDAATKGSTINRGPFGTNSKEDMDITE